MVRRGAPAPSIGRLHQPPESEGPDFDGAAAVAPAPDRGCNRSRKRRYPEAEGTARDRAGVLAPSHAPALAAHRHPRVSPRLHAGQRPRLVDRKVIPLLSSAPSGSHFDILTKVTALTRLLASRKLPSLVTDVLRTMLPPPGMAQLWNRVLLGSKRTTVFGVEPDSLYQMISSMAEMP